jgi:hypothetical protein
VFLPLLDAERAGKGGSGEIASYKDKTEEGEVNTRSTCTTGARAVFLQSLHVWILVPTLPEIL